MKNTLWKPTSCLLFSTTPATLTWHSVSPCMEWHDRRALCCLDFSFVHLQYWKWNSGPRHGRQALYHWGIPPALFTFWFWYRVSISCPAWPGIWNWPASAPQLAGIMIVRHHTQLRLLFLSECIIKTFSLPSYPTQCIRSDDQIKHISRSWMCYVSSVVFTSALLRSWPNSYSSRLADWKDVSNRLECDLKK